MVTCLHPPLPGSSEPPGDSGQGVRSSVDIWTCSHHSPVLGTLGQLGQALHPSQLLSQDNSFSGQDLPGPCGQLCLTPNPEGGEGTRPQLSEWAAPVASMSSHRAGGSPSQDSGQHPGHRCYYVAWVKMAWVGIGRLTGSSCL